MPRSSPQPVLLLVGTTKGAFLVRGNRARTSWSLDGPFFPGHQVYAMAYDGRGGRRRLYAATENPFYGTVLHTSDDLGKSWTDPKEPNVRFDESSGLSLKRIWQICPGPESEPQRLWLGVEPSALFESRDGGATWTANAGLLTHPHRERWTPGNGGMCLHTIVPDASGDSRLLVAMSTGGVYRSDDGGRSWRARNVGVRAEFLPDKHPEFGQCVHKVVSHPSRPGRLFLQNHWGLYRSDDWGDTWQDIANGVPSDFGFAMAMHPHEPDTVYIVPLQSDLFRCVPGAKLRVYRTRNAGASWQPMSRGLPQRDAYESVLRDALATDTLDPAGVYFGTRSGKLFASRDAGASWRQLFGGLPPIVVVKAAVPSPAPARATRKAAARKRRAPARGRRA